MRRLAVTVILASAVSACGDKEPAPAAPAAYVEPAPTPSAVPATRQPETPAGAATPQRRDGPVYDGKTY
jgi:hypothetical protein